MNFKFEKFLVLFEKGCNSEEILSLLRWIPCRDLIEVGVNVTVSKEKKETLSDVRVSMSSGPVRPGSSYNVY